MLEVILYLFLFWFFKYLALGVVALLLLFLILQIIKGQAKKLESKINSFTKGDKRE